MNTWDAASMEIDIWVDDNEGHRSQMGFGNVTSRDEAMQLMGLAWDTLVNMRAGNPVSTDSLSEGVSKIRNRVASTYTEPVEALDVVAEQDTGFRQGDWRPHGTIQEDESQ